MVLTKNKGNVRPIGNLYSMLDTFPKASQIRKIPNKEFPNWQLPKSVLAAALGPPPIAACGASEGLIYPLEVAELGNLHNWNWEATTWEIVTWEANLGKMLLGKYLTL